MSSLIEQAAKRLEQLRQAGVDVPVAPAARPAAPEAPGRQEPGQSRQGDIDFAVLSSSAAMLIAKLIAVNVLPSPATALVTMIRLPCLTGTAPRPIAFAIKGRLMTLNWSDVVVRGAVGVMKFPRASAAKSARMSRS